MVCQSIEMFSRGSTSDPLRGEGLRYAIPQIETPTQHRRFATKYERQGDLTVLNGNTVGEQHQNKYPGMFSLVTLHDWARSGSRRRIQCKSDAVCEEPK